MKPSQLELLKSRRFAPLFATQFLGAFNDNVFKNALIIYITFSAAAEVRSQSAGLVTLAAGIFILPFFLFSATAGQLADKYEKSLLIRRVKLAEIGIMVLAAIGFWAGEVWALIGVLFLMGAQSAIFGPLKYAILPQHLEAHELTAGNGLVQGATFLAILIGTILGGLVVSIGGVGPMLISVLVIAFALGGWATSRWIPHAAPPDPDLQLNSNIAAHTLRMMSYARENRSVFASIIGIAWFWFIGATFLQLLPTYTRDVLGGNAHVVTLMLAAFSIGIGIGAVLCGRISAGQIETGLVVLGAIGLSVFSVGVYVLGRFAGLDSEREALLGIGAFLSHAHSWLIFFDLLAVSIFGGLYIVPLFTLVQSRAAPERRAQIIAANNIVSAMFMVASALLTIGLLRLDFSADEILLVVGLVNLLVVGAVFAAAPEFPRRFLAWSGLRPSPAPPTHPNQNAGGPNCP